MRYIAALQRFDDAHVDVIETDNRDVAINGAIALYNSLVPTMLQRGEQAIRRRADDEQYDSPDETFWRQKRDSLKLHGLSSCLQAEEWNITVYDREMVDDANGIPLPPQMIFTIGALETDSKLAG